MGAAVSDPLRRIAISLLLAVLLSWPAVAAAREEILQFDSLIEVQSDGGIIVTENITVRAEGRQIKRGIYRELPVNYISSLGDRRPAGFKLLKVDSTATGDAHFTERLGENIRIYAGQRHRRLDPGVYTYTFRYSMAHQLGYFERYDEIYWNVTGNRWTFPINKVTARIILPAGATILQTAAYTGRRGSTGKDFSVSRISDTVAEFTATRQLAPQEEMTVSVGWPKGIVAAPGAGDQAMTWLFGNSGLMALFASAMAVPWYLFSSWLRVGRDPEKGVII
ncbi:MAG: DUF2207 domain-containing protein, partial [Rhizobiales bacterium]|nr:DUF2207 domain-containing protein [Hyphomicrobiales bacterium]